MREEGEVEVGGECEGLREEGEEGHKAAQRETCSEREPQCHSFQLRHTTCIQYMNYMYIIMFHAF